MQPAHLYGPRAAEARGHPFDLRSHSQAATGSDAVQDRQRGTLEPTPRQNGSSIRPKPLKAGGSGNSVALDGCMSIIHSAQHGSKRYEQHFRHSGARHNLHSWHYPKKTEVHSPKHSNHTTWPKMEANVTEFMQNQPAQVTQTLDFKHKI